MPVNLIKIVQHNLNKSRIASMQLRDYSLMQDIDILLLQEPFIQGKQTYGFEGLGQIHTGDSAGAAIIIMKDHLRVITLAQYNSDYIVTAKV